MLWYYQLQKQNTTNMATVWQELQNLIYMD